MVWIFFQNDVNQTHLYLRSINFGSIVFDQSTRYFSLSNSPMSLNLGISIYHIFMINFILNNTLLLLLYIFHKYNNIQMFELFINFCSLNQLWIWLPLTLSNSTTQSSPYNGRTKNVVGINLASNNWKLGGLSNSKH